MHSETLLENYYPLSPYLAVVHRFLLELNPGLSGRASCVTDGASLASVSLR